MQGLHHHPAQPVRDQGLQHRRHPPDPAEIRSRAVLAPDRAGDLHPPVRVGGGQPVPESGQGGHGSGMPRTVGGKHHCLLHHRA